MVKKIYTINFKLKIARLSLESEKLFDLSNRLGITVPQILEWRKLLNNDFITQSFINNEMNCYSSYKNKDFMLIKIRGCVGQKRF